VSLLDGALRIVLTTAHYLLRASWLVRRPETFGAHAVALTPDGKVILVRLRYAPGWRLPGGGRPGDEPAVDAALRELREEIGLTAYADVKVVRDFKERPHFKRGTASLVVVRDVRYRPRWNLEVEAICEADLGALPSDTSAKTRFWIEEVREQL
jgi:8-oxo-dGTP pyrophosphatase MutT (NUDIX family)